MNNLDPSLLLREKSKSPGYTQSRIAQEIGVSLPYINAVIAGRRQPSERVLAYLGLKRSVTVVYELTSPLLLP